MNPEPANLLECSTASFEAAQDIAIDSPDIASGYERLLRLWRDHAGEGHPSTPYVLAVDPVADGDALLAWVERELNAKSLDPNAAGLWFEFIWTDRAFLRVEELWLAEPHPDDRESRWDFGGWIDANRSPDEGSYFASMAYPATYDSDQGDHSYTFDMAYAGLLAAHVGRHLDPMLLKLHRPDALFYAGSHEGDAMFVGKLSQSGGWCQNTAREPVL